MLQGYALPPLGAYSSPVVGGRHREAAHSLVPLTSASDLDSLAAFGNTPILPKTLFYAFWWPILPVEMRPTSRTEFAIAIICALTLEADAVEALFDEPYDRLSRYYRKHPSDSNTYINGRIGKHNVVLSYMPGMGKGSAASVAANLRVSYPEVRLALVVGICGGVPSVPGYTDIFLGDVIISNSVVEYDFGKQYPDGFKRKTDVLDTLGRPDQEIRGFLKGLDARRTRMEYQERILHHLHALQENDGLRRHPQIDDILFESSYVHKHYEKTSACACDGYSICEGALDTGCADIGCKDSEVRRRRSETAISMHIGPVASADTVMKSAQHRDEITKRERVIAFEMEGAGVWDIIPCIIIKGVCDYADSHKNKSWQKYAAATGASAAKAFLEDWRPTQQDTSTSRHLMIPFGRNPRFVGRQDEILELERSMSMPDGPKRLAITGLGGVGKTQVALELTYRVRDREPHCSIFWIPCISYEAVEQTFMAIAETVEGENRKPADVKQWFKTYFSQTDSDWLLIFDNADDMEMWTKGDNSTPQLTDFIPFNNKGHVIFTTRNGELAVDLVSSDVVHIHALDKTSGVEFLDKSLRKNVDRDYQAMLDLLEQLTFLPLAISQAVAYINKRNISISDYLALLATQEKDVVDLLSKDFGDNHRYKDVQNPVAKTWLISFTQIQSLNPLAAEYLSLMACVHPQYIPRIFLAPEFNMQMVDALGLLNAFSFITLQSGNVSLQSENCFITLHRLVYLATRSWMRMEGQLPAYISKAADRLEQGLHMDQHWRKCLHPAVHLLSDPVLHENEARHQGFLENVMCCFLDDGGHAKARNLLVLYGKAGYYEAGVLLLRILMMHQPVTGPNWHPETICLLHDLASLFLAKGRLGEAESIGILALEKRINLLGPEHPDTLCTLDTLACTYRQQGKHKKAEEVDALVLEARRNGPRPQSFATLDILDKCVAGWEETERVHIQVMEIRKRVLGPEHRLTLMVMASLLRKYIARGQWKEAENIAIQAMEGQRQELGAGHPETIESMQTLSLVYAWQGRPQEAAELQATVMEEARRMVDQEHPYSLLIMYKIAIIWNNIGKVEEAKGLMEKCAELGRRVLGPDHPYTMQCSDELRRWASKDQVG